MDEKSTDLKAALRELVSEGSSQAGPHVGLKRLIAYREGRLPAAEREALQEHLSLCPRCTDQLRELRDFAAAAGGSGAPGPQPLQEEAWASLLRNLPRLPGRPPAVRPIAAARLRQTRRDPRLFYAAAAALALAVLGLSLWALAATQQDRARIASLERRLVEREDGIAELQRSLAGTERQLGLARGQIQRLESEKAERTAAASADREQDARRIEELTRRVADLSSDLAELRRTAQPDRVAVASRPVELSVAPRFALRGQKPPELQGGGAVNSVSVPPEPGRFTVGVSLAGHPVYHEYRFELSDRDGEVLWSGRRPGKGLLGDAGTSVLVNGIGPGLYRLRIEGLQADRTELLAEYLLEVSFQPS